MHPTLPLLSNGGLPWHWAMGGAFIGLITLALLWVTNRRLGISTGYENLCSLVSDAPYFKRSALFGTGTWRFPFLGGLLVGGVLATGLGGAWHLQWNLGIFDAAIGGGTGMKVAWMFVGGVAIGFGTRLAGGCTSGHGIFGLSNFEPASWVSTISFMAAGIVTTNFVYRVLFPVVAA